VSAAASGPHLSRTAAPAAHARTWPALLVLFLLPGLTAETLTTSTPIVTYLTKPAAFLSLTLLYGSAAILIRELARWRGLGWASILLLGAAFGIFEEGLVVNTWANPWLPQVCRFANGTATGLCDYSRVAGINLAWAAMTMVFHAAISIAVPILLVELLFPRSAASPWLGRKAPLAFAGAELLVLALGLNGSITSFQQHGLEGPFALPYLIEIALMASIVLLALAIVPFVPIVPSSPTSKVDAPQTDARPAPRLWMLRLVGFVALLLDLLLAGVFQSAQAPFEYELATAGVLLGLGTWRLSTWARRDGWDERHLLALASGALGFFLLVLAPVFELAGNAGTGLAHGTALVALVYLLFLVFMARRVARRVRTNGAVVVASRNGATAIPDSA